MQVIDTALVRLNVLNAVETMSEGDSGVTNVSICFTATIEQPLASPAEFVFKIFSLTTATVGVDVTRPS